MKDNEKRPPHDPHNPPPGDPECDCKKKKKKEKKHRRRRGPVLFLILIIVILLALIYFFRDGLGLGGNGNGTGSGDSVSDTSSDPSDQSSEISSEQSSDITEIRIEQEAIYIGSELCKDENDLKEKITAAGSGKKYVLIHDTAIKETYDKVKPMLLELKDALELEINFNE